MPRFGRVDSTHGMQQSDPTPASCESPLPERLLSRLAGLPRLFTRPTWQNVLLLVAGAILAPGKRTVTAALRILGREQENDFPIYHGVLSRAVWSSRAVAGWLLRLLVASFLGADATVVIGIDDTIERRWGHKISARGIYRDPTRSSKGHFVKTSGLRWLSAQLLVHIPWAGRIMGLPFLTVLAPVQALLCRQTTLAQDVAGLGPPGRTAGPSLAAGPPDCHRRRHGVRRHRLPRRRPKLCQCRHPTASRRQSLCPRAAQTTGPWTTTGQGQAAAHADASAARCQHRLAAPHRHSLVRPRQSCRRDRHRHRRLVSQRLAPGAHSLAVGARSARRTAAAGLPLHRPRRRPRRYPSVVRLALAVGSYLSGSPRPSRRRNPTPVVRPRDHAHHPGTAWPVLAD